MNAAGRNMHQRGGDGNAQSDRDFGEWSNSTYTESQKPRPGDRRSNRQNHHANNHQQGNSRDWNQASNNNSSANAKSSSNHGSNNNSGGRGGVKGGSNVPKWQVGDECLAKYWEDGGFYSAKITAMSKSTAVVLFQEYGNHEEVMLTDIMTVPFMGRSANDSGSGNNSKRSGGGSGGGRYIPTTPGLPPAFKQST